MPKNLGKVQEFSDPVIGIGHGAGASAIVGFEVDHTNGTPPQFVYDKSDESWKSRSAGGTLTAIGGGGVPDQLLYTNRQNNGTDGGTATSGSWQTYPLNTEDHDTGNNGSIASNAVTIGAGTYRYEAMGTGYQCGWFQLRLRQTSGTATTHGSSGLTFPRNSTGGDQVQNVFTGRFTIASQETVELQYRVTNTVSTYGLGQAPASTDGWGETFDFGYLKLVKE